MGKKDKKVFALAEDFQALVAMVPKIKAVIDAHKEIASAYQKYRKNGGDAIPGVEKHLGVKEQKDVSSVPSTKKKETAAKKEVKAPKEATASNNTKKKAKE